MVSRYAFVLCVALVSAGCGEPLVEGEAGQRRCGAKCETLSDFFYYTGTINYVRSPDFAPIKEDPALALLSTTQRLALGNQGYLAYWTSRTDEKNAIPQSVEELERRLRPIRGGAGATYPCGAGFIGPSSHLVSESGELKALEDYLHPKAIAKIKENIAKGQMNEVTKLSQLWSALARENLSTLMKEDAEAVAELGTQHSVMYHILDRIFEGAVAQLLKDGNMGKQGNGSTFSMDNGTRYEVHGARYSGFQASPFGDSYLDINDEDKLYRMGRTDVAFYKTHKAGGVPIPYASQPRFTLSSLGVRNVRFGFYGGRFAAGADAINEWNNNGGLMTRNPEYDKVEDKMTLTTIVANQMYRIDPKGAWQFFELGQH